MGILSGFKKYKEYLKTDDGYQPMSRWTKSDAVIMGDGTDDTNTLEQAFEQLNSDLANYIPLKEVTGTLSVGSTSITLSNSSITTSSTIDVYTDKFGVNPTNMTVSTGKIVLTFKAQSSAVNVKVRVS